MLADMSPLGMYISCQNVNNECTVCKFEYTGFSYASEMCLKNWEMVSQRLLRDKF